MEEKSIEPDVDEEILNESFEKEQRLKTKSSLDNESILSQFIQFRDYMDHENELRESLFRLSRDVTIKSKRIIGFLQR